MNLNIFDNLPESSKAIIQDFLSKFKEKIIEDIVNYQNVTEAIKKTAEKGIETRVQLHQIDQETEKAATGIIEKSELIMERQNEISKIAKRLRENSEKEERNLIPFFESLLLNILEVSKIIKGKTIEDSIKDKIKKMERDLIIMTADKIMSHEVVADSIIHQEKIAYENSDDLFEILNLCQFQDITSQELAKAHTLIKTIIDRLNFVLSAFNVEELSLNHQMKIKPHFELASYGDKTKEQKEVDTLFSTPEQIETEKKEQAAQKSKDDYDIFEQIKSEYEEKLSKDEEKSQQKETETVKVQKGPRDIYKESVTTPKKQSVPEQQKVIAKKAPEPAGPPPLPREDLEIFQTIRSEFSALREKIKKDWKNKPEGDTSVLNEDDKKIFNQIKSEFESMKQDLKSQNSKEIQESDESLNDFDLFDQIKKEYDENKDIEMTEDEMKIPDEDSEESTQIEENNLEDDSSEEEENPEDLFEQLQREYQAEKHNDIEEENADDIEIPDDEEESITGMDSSEEQLLAMLDDELEIDEDSETDEESDNDLDLDDLAKKFEDAGDGDVISQEEIDKILSGG